MDICKKEVDTLYRSKVTNDLASHVLVITTLANGLALILFESMRLFFGVTATLLLIACGVNYLVRFATRSNDIKLEIADQLRAEAVIKREALSLEVKRGLNELGETLATNQLDLLHEKFESYLTVLNLQFDDGELTHRRYLTAAERLFLGAVDSLKQYLLLSHAIKDIDTERLNKQIQSEEDQLTIVQLKERLTLYRETTDRKQLILQSNEAVMTALNKSTTELAKITTKSESNQSIEDSLQEVNMLISRTHLYNQKD
ncbi:hypothetical protein [Vibrio penaeicida]|uniref:Chromosome partitioning protein ParA n=1 Tax=Vibrio penaeicida TaxID=104609 RepID=A0AAV5NLB2_9VIBR|nr:hypothetical protein [Vibrio penaeicida]RTZ24907.1 hypothetical protein EKN09_01155 [Vibrio penaeicida]GLQ71208.1 hypothetical protein GCM10007932_05680 [Vibrio penaeicida]